VCGREVGERVGALLGAGTASEIAGELKRLRGELESATREEARRELGSALVLRFGEHLPDDEYLAYCRHCGYTALEVNRLLDRDRAEDALAAAQAAIAREAEQRQQATPLCLQELAKSFLERGHPAIAERLLRPYARADALVAHLFARALVAQGSDEAGAAMLSWFSRRPTGDTYREIAETMPKKGWPALRESIRAHLLEKSLKATLIDVFVHDEDVPALVALLPSIRGVEFEHARTRAKPLLTRLAPDQLGLLDRRPDDAAQATTSDAPPPARVSHPKFGGGRVVRVEGRGDQRKYTIAFDAAEHGEKTLLARFVVPAAD
jgi:hypothetical protein